MNMQKALDLIQLAKSHQCRLFIAPPNQLRWESPVMPPDELLEELRANKPILIEYLKHTSRDLSMLVKRALDGYHWLLDRKRTHYRYNGVPIVTVRISASEWRETVKSVLKCGFDLKYSIPLQSNDGSEKTQQTIVEVLEN